MSEMLKNSERVKEYTMKLTVEDVPASHWLGVEGHNEPPAPIKMGKSDKLTLHFSRPVNDGMGSELLFSKGNYSRGEMEEFLRDAARFAVRYATDNGRNISFDFDLFVQLLALGLFSYNTTDGESLPHPFD